MKSKILISLLIVALTLSIISITLSIIVIFSSNHKQMESIKEIIMVEEKNSVIEEDLILEEQSIMTDKEYLLNLLQIPAAIDYINEERFANTNYISFSNFKERGLFDSITYPEPIGRGYEASRMIPSGDGVTALYDPSFNQIVIVNLPFPEHYIGIACMDPTGRMVNNYLDVDEFDQYSYDEWNNIELDKPAIGFDFYASSDFLPGIWKFTVNIDKKDNPIYFEVEIVDYWKIKVAEIGNRNPFYDYYFPNESHQVDKFQENIIYIFGKELEVDSDYKITLFKDPIKIESGGTKVHGSKSLLVKTDSNGEFIIKWPIRNSLEAGSYTVAYSLNYTELTLDPLANFIVK